MMIQIGSSSRAWNIITLNCMYIEKNYKSKLGNLDDLDHEYGKFMNLYKRIRDYFEYCDYVSLTESEYLFMLNILEEIDNK